MSQAHLNPIPEGVVIPHGTRIFSCSDDGLEGTADVPQLNDFEICVQGRWADVIELPYRPHTLVRYLRASFDSAEDDGRIGFDLAIDYELLSHGEFPYVSKVEAGTWADRNGIREGDWLTDLNRQPVLDLPLVELEEQLENVETSTLFRFERQTSYLMQVTESPVLQVCCPGSLTIVMRYGESERVATKQKTLSPHLRLEVEFLNAQGTKPFRTASQKLPTAFWDVEWVDLVLADRKLFFRFNGEQQKGRRLSAGIIRGLRRCEGRQVRFSCSSSWAWTCILQRPVEVQAFDDDSDADDVADDACQIVFAIDRSRSMNTSDVLLNGGRRKRIDAVRSIIQDYIHLSASSQKDRYTVVFFADEAEVVFAGLRSDDALDRLEDQMSASGGTSFVSAIRGIRKVVQAAAYQSRVIILSDGCPGDSYIGAYNEMLRSLGSAVEAKRLQVFTVGLGLTDEHAVARLQQLAALGGGGYQPCHLSGEALRLAFGSISRTITSQRRTASLGSSSLPAVSAALPGWSVGHIEYELPLQFNISSAEFWAQRCEYIFTGTAFEKRQVETEVRWRDLPFQRGGLRQVHSMLEGLDVRRVAKFPIHRLRFETSTDTPDLFAQQTAIAIYFAKEFCSVVNADPEKFRYTPCFAYQAQRWNRDGSVDKCTFSGEDVLVGMFIKWNSNEGYVNAVENSCEAQAFSHFTYEASCRKLMVADVQGVRDGPRMTLTDPQVLSTDMVFGRGDLGPKGMEAFLASHTCNYQCDKWKRWRDSAASRSEGGNRSSLLFTGQIHVGPIEETAATGSRPQGEAAQPRAARKEKVPALQEMLKRQSRRPRPKASRK